MAKTMQISGLVVKMVLSYDRDDHGRYFELMSKYTQEISFIRLLESNQNQATLLVPGDRLSELWVTLLSEGFERLK